MSSKDHVIEAALKLSEQDRLEIAELLYESLEGPPGRTEEEWDQEIERRVKLVEEGKAKFLTWEEARRLITEGGDGSANP
jgi:putative addiction module component (TIGR02574 family)